MFVAISPREEFEDALRAIFVFVFVFDLISFFSVHGTCAER